MFPSAYFRPTKMVTLIVVELNGKEGGAALVWSAKVGFLLQLSIGRGGKER